MNAKAFLVAAVPFSILICGVGDTPANADWQGTRWGMSAAEVQSAVPHLEKPSDAEQSTFFGPIGAPQLKGKHSTLGHDFVTFFYFRNGGLVRVRLEATDRNIAKKLFDAMKAEYGEPSTNKSSPFQSCERFDVAWNVGKDTIMLNGATCEEERHKFANRATIYFNAPP